MIKRLSYLFLLLIALNGSLFHSAHAKSTEDVHAQVYKRVGKHLVKKPKFVHNLKKTTSNDAARRLQILKMFGFQEDFVDEMPVRDPSIDISVDEDIFTILFLFFLLFFLGIGSGTTTTAPTHAPTVTVVTPTASP
eukprot:CAMPEP_0178957308 /NCGR_PEP_ID=MMETSP0789-20121207/10829_1 /TAXON_ID=3005 /ORGANISM="Rhizosolenia setigera, Strain CCMP 1694" /LENGTH=135 /DNA_ID=CAMNT_0020639517 /DNA_START=48 /DNA_END=455 /DNA_ORIENTATION=+